MSRLPGREAGVALGCNTSSRMSGLVRIEGGDGPEIDVQPRWKWHERQEGATALRYSSVEPRVPCRPAPPHATLSERIPCPEWDGHGRTAVPAQDDLDRMGIPRHALVVLEQGETFQAPPAVAGGPAPGA